RGRLRSRGLRSPFLSPPSLISNVAETGFDISGLPRRKRVRDFDRLALEQLEGELLGKQHVINGKATFGHETKHARTSAAFIQHLDVHLAAVPDAVAVARVAPDHVEAIMAFVLRALRR